MIKVGLIGYGKWGKVLYKKLVNFCDVKFICTSRDDYESKLNDVDWVIIATPDKTHFKIVRNCILAGKNVFCEKPLTLSYEESRLLFKQAKMRNVKLYVDDIQNYRQYDFQITDNNKIVRKKSGGGNLKNVLNRLTYHDIYTLYPFIKDLEFKGVDIFQKKDKLFFNVTFDNKYFEFLYDLNSDEIEHTINGCTLTGDDDILTEMLTKVLHKDVDFSYNETITLFTNKIIDNIKRRIFPKVAVIGGGIFGCTTAWKLAENGYEVDLFEKNNDIMKQASSINQYRLHRGYHYPRSKDTAVQSQWGESSFIKEYGEAVVNGDVEHYYCIASQDSKVTAKQYVDFLNDVNLYYEEKKLDFLQENVVDLVVKVKEYLFDPKKLKQICWDKLNKHDVNVILNTEYMDSDYESVVNATYANLNVILPSDKQKKYQFELCEKPVVKLSKEYKNKSVVVMDGPFMCIDPLGDTGLHVMGNVVHAIHSTNVGKFPEYDSKFDDLLNNGIVKNPSVTNIDKFIDSAKMFFKDIESAEHIGSMFTIRTVLPNRDKDDARPTLVENPTDNIFNLFSGKIGTCVSATEELMEYV
jgi:hypothetical protein